MKDEILKAIAAYLWKETEQVEMRNGEFVRFRGKINTAHFTHSEFCKEIAEEITAAIEPLLSQDSGWEDAPDWAKWRTVDIDSTVTFWEEKPKHSIHNNRWTTSGGKTLTKGLKCIKWKTQIKQR